MDAVTIFFTELIAGLIVTGVTIGLVFGVIWAFIKFFGSVPGLIVATSSIVFAYYYFANGVVT